MQTLPDPVLRSKMPLFNRTIASTGLTKSQNMSGFLGKQALQYNGSCFTYDPRGKEGAGLTSPWRTNSKTSLLDGRSPVTHLSGTERQNHIIYRQDTSSSEEGHSNSSSMNHASVKQGFVLYSKTPEISSPTPAIRKQTKAGSEDSSSHSENSVYLAIPKPVYRHNPCCNELGCVIGQRYTVEHGSPRIPNTIYEHNWMQSEAHYIERSPLQRKAQDALLQQRGLHFEAGAEPLKRITLEPYSPGKTRNLSLEPNYSSYPCAPTHTLFGSLSEHSQPLQTSPRGYPSLYPSQPTYEHMTSEVYQEHSLIPKYGQLAQHPMFYYPQANVEVENRQQCKDSGSKQREDVPVIHKHTISNPRERYIVPQPLHAEIPLPTTEMLQNHPFIQRFDYPCYAIQRFHLNASQIRPPLKRSNMSPNFHSSHINVSPTSQPHPAASDTRLHKDQSSIGLQANQFHDSPFLRMDQISPTRRVSQHAVSPSSIQIGRYFSPLTSLHIDPPLHSPAGLNVNKLLDYSSCKAQVTCPKQPQSLPVSRAAWLPHSPKPSVDRIHTAAHNSTNVRKIIYSPAVATGSKHNVSVTSPGNGVHKGSLKRSIFHSSAPMKIKEEDNDVYEVEVSKKPKLEMEDKNDSPPMPIIDTVFSLAPYQACLRTSGVLIPGRAPQTAFQHSERHEVKPSTDIKRKRIDRDEDEDENHSAASVGYKDTSPKDTLIEQTAAEPKNIKEEKVDTLEMGDAVETCIGENDCIKVTIKKEAEETDAPDSEPEVLKVKCEPTELENKPTLADENQTSDESKHAALTAQVSSLSHSDTYTLYQQTVTLQPQTTAPPQPPESKVDFKNIPPQCLKLSTYNIIIPDIKHYSPAPLPEKPAALPVPKLTAEQNVQTPVRKHFFELHNSLCTLVSKAVSASAEHELKNYMSQLQINEPVSPSTKVQKVSSMLGVKAREVWINEEMKKALENVLERLREYTTQERCPFPHVMRTGAVFIPMLVVKELLFPMVQGNFIDQVLQEHKVELRPTTLSEEKILIQLHKRACSSRLRRLMSLKHLPDVYADVVNLLHYTCVCKHLGE